MVVVLSVARVLALLGVCPATHLLQAACRVPSLDQAQGLQVPTVERLKTSDIIGVLQRGTRRFPGTAAPLLEITNC